MANIRLASCKALALLDHGLSPVPQGEETTLTVGEVLKKLAKDGDIDVGREARLALKDMTEDKTDLGLRARTIQDKENMFFNSGLDKWVFPSEFACFDIIFNNTTIALLGSRNFLTCQLLCSKVPLREDQTQVICIEWRLFSSVSTCSLTLMAVTLFGHRRPLNIAFSHLA